MVLCHSPARTARRMIGAAAGQRDDPITPSAATLAAMPLYARRVADHYPDRERPSADDFVVLSGSLEVGSFHRVATGPSEGRWSWGTGLGAATAKFVTTGYATAPDECRTHIGESFRAILARADLRERRDA